MARAVPPYKILTASNWTELGLPGSLRAFESQYFLGGRRRALRGDEGPWVMRNRNTPKRVDAIKPGKPVWKPGSETPPLNTTEGRKGKLFFSNSFKLDKRHDCTQINGEWYCVYSPDEWKEYRQSLKDFHKKNLEMMQAGTTFNIASGKTQTREEVQADADYLGKISKQVGEKFARDHPRVVPEPAPPPTPSSEVALKIKDAQRVLLENMGALVAFNGVAKEKTPLKTISSYVGDPSAFTNVLTSPTAGASSGFVHATPAALGLLVPKLRFFYVTTDPTMSDPYKRDSTEEILFPDHTLGSQVIALSDARAAGSSKGSDILKSRDSVGTDVGVKDFHWTYDNKSFGENVLKAEMTIHFGSAADMVNDKYIRFLFTNGEAPKPNSHLRAAKVPGKPDRSASQTMQQLQREIGMRKLMMSVHRGYDFEETGEEEIKDKNLAYMALKVLVGWSRPEGAQLPLEVSDDFLSALEATQRLITLNLFTYKLDFRQEGQVDLKLSFGGSIGALLADTQRSDVLSVGAAAKALRKKPVDVPLFLPAPKSDSDSAPPQSLADSGRVMWNGYVYKAIQRSGNALRFTPPTTAFGMTLPGEDANEPVVPLTLEGIE